ncbi:MAG: hypothetical protein ACYDAG_14045, partial [Chloroflexota bacterium]
QVLPLDFSAQYPHVAQMMGAEDVLLAEHIGAEDALADMQQIIAELTATGPRGLLAQPGTWRRLAGFVRVFPQAGDLIPVHVRQPNGDFRLTLAHLAAWPNDQPCWLPLPDVIAAWVHTGRWPEIAEAWRLVPEGRLPSLQAVDFGPHHIEPGHLFEGLLAARDTATPGRRSGAKIALNGLYGLLSERHRHHLDRPVRVRVWAGEDERFDADTRILELLGSYAFPPLARLTEAGGHLLQALVEVEASEAGGRVIYGDTDSSHVADLHAADVLDIASRFDGLGGTGFLRPIAEAHAGNDRAKPLRGLHGWYVTTKRYVLFRFDRNGSPRLVTASEHGLGHLLEPEPGAWQAAWQAELDRIHHVVGRKEPAWFRDIAFEIPTDQPAGARPFETWIEPAASLVYPAGSAPRAFIRFHPGDSPADLVRRSFVGLDGKTRARVATSCLDGGPLTRIAATYRDILRQHFRSQPRAHRPEIVPLVVEATGRSYVLSDERGTPLGEVVRYGGPVWPMVRQVVGGLLAAGALDELRTFGLSRTAAYELAASRRSPHREVRERLLIELARWCRKRLPRAAKTTPLSDYAALVAWLRFGTRPEKPVPKPRALAACPEHPDSPCPVACRVRRYRARLKGQAA